MCDKRLIDVGDLVKINKPFFYVGQFNLIDDEYDVGIVLEKSPENYQEDYLVLLVNHLNENRHITYKRLNEVKKL
tara:strand:+ start:21256 stop:21480 length:225 start_codon:yes stop_codon:yes gene_type:complete